MPAVLAELPQIFGREQHVFRAGSPFAAIGEIKISIAAGDVVGRRIAELPRGTVDPSRAPFDLEKIADRRFVQQDFARARSLGVLGAKLLVPKDGVIPDLVENLLERLGIGK